MAQNENPFVGITAINVRPRREPNWRESRYQYAWNEYTAKPRLHVFVEGETIFENLFARWERPYQAYREFLLPTVRRVLNLGDDVKFRWSQKAGCSCGCSPAFIVTVPGDAYDHPLQRHDIDITVKMA